MRWGVEVGRVAALGIALSLLGCSHGRQNVPVERPPDSFWTEKDWRGTSVYVASTSATQDIAPIVEAGFAEARFIVVGTREEARLVVRLEQGDAYGEGGSVGAQYFAGGGRVVDAVASYDGQRVADAHVDLKFTVAMREGESWAEFTWREDLERTAADEFVGATIVEQILARIPLRASVKATKEGQSR